MRELLSDQLPAIVMAQVSVDRDWTLMQLLSYYPWLIIVILSLLIPITGIIFGTITHYLRDTRLAEIDAALKHEMLQKGMSAEEIRMVLEASSQEKAKRRCSDSRHARS